MQAFIGNKVRQAERLHNTSQKAMRLARQLIESLISRAICEDDLMSVIARVGNPVEVDDVSLGLPEMTDLNTEVGRSFISRISGVALTERLDSGFYQKEFLDNERRIHECGLPLRSIGSISEKCNCARYA